MCEPFFGILQHFFQLQVTLHQLLQALNVFCVRLLRVVQLTLHVKDALVRSGQFVLRLGFDLLAVVCNALPMVNFTCQVLRVKLKLTFLLQ